MTTTDDNRYRYEHARLVSDVHALVEWLGQDFGWPVDNEKLSMIVLTGAKNYLMEALLLLGANADIDQKEIESTLLEIWSQTPS